MSSGSVIFEFQTVQSNVIYKLIDALKDILTEANIICTKDGLKICTVNQSATILAHLKLEAGKFEFYKCERDSLQLGLNIQYMFKIMKNMSNTDILTWRVWDTDMNRLEIQISNPDKGTKKIIKLNLLDLPTDDKRIPRVKFESTITIPSPDFQKICRDMSFISEVIEIQSVARQLKFKCEGDVAEMETIMDYGDSEEMVSTTGEIVQGFYNLKDLCLFMKCANLCNNIEMYLKNDFPLIIQFQIGSLGYLKLGLSPNVNN